MTQEVSPDNVRQTIVDIIYRGGASHLGTSMSMVEMLIAAYGSVNINKIKAGADDRSRIFVSKGHGAACTYSVMHHFGLISYDEIATYHQNGSILAGHVSHGVSCVEHSTGALGHGLSVAAGTAVGLRSKGFNDAFVFCLLGDGEIQEGSCWEALMFIKHHNLYNLVTMIDYNKISSITRTDDVIDLRPLAQRFEGFGFRVFEVDGHSLESLFDAIKAIRESKQPSVMVCNTVKGKGVPFAENDPIWHYRSLNDEAYKSLKGVFS